MWRALSRAAFDLTSSVALGLAVILLPLPVAALWYAHGDPDRYAWFRLAPAPIDDLLVGGSIGMLWFVASCWALAVCLLGVAGALRLRLAQDRWTQATVALLALSAPPAALLGLGAVLTVLVLP